MRIKLCYKEYNAKISLKACKVFFDETGLDLQTVFMRYIAHCSKTQGMLLAERLVSFSELYTRDIASKALHSVIIDDNIPLAEIEDATYRVGWLESGRDDDISEPWAMVMLSTALQINDYFTKELAVKKLDTSDSSQEK